MDQRSFDHIQFLSSSPERVQILERLRKAPSDPRDVAGRVSKSRRCVQRDLSKFEDRGWVEKRNGAYRLTTYGAAIVTQYTDQATAISTIDRHEPLFAQLPDSDHLPDPQWLPGANTVIADSGRPHAPLNLYVNGIRRCSADTLRGIVPIFSQSFKSAHIELLERGVETAIITDAKTIETARSSDAEGVATALRLDGLSVYEHGDPVDFALAIANDQGFLGAFDGQGRFVACVEFTDTAFLNWADGLYERYRDRSERIEPDDETVVPDPSLE